MKSKFRSIMKCLPLLALVALGVGCTETSAVVARPQPQIRFNSVALDKERFHYTCSEGENPKKYLDQTTKKLFLECENDRLVVVLTCKKDKTPTVDLSSPISTNPIYVCA